MPTIDEVTEAFTRICKDSNYQIERKIAATMTGELFDLTAFDILLSIGDERMRNIAEGRDPDYVEKEMPARDKLVIALFPIVCKLQDSPLTEKGEKMLAEKGLDIMSEDEIGLMRELADTAIAALV